MFALFCIYLQTLRTYICDNTITKNKFKFFIYKQKPNDS